MWSLQRGRELTWNEATCIVLSFRLNKVVQLHDAWSFLLFASLLSLLLFLSSSWETVCLPHLFYMLIVVFFRYFKWRWKYLHNGGMLLLVGPVGSTISEVVSQINIDILGNEEFTNLNVPFASSDVKAREADLIFYLRVTSAIHELLKCIDHVFLSSKMHGCVSTDVLMVRNVWLGSILE